MAMIGKERMTAMNIVKLLMCAYIVGMMAFPFLIFFNAVTSIIGVILFFYLWRTQQLEISGKVFFCCRIFYCFLDPWAV
jgi:hypothetical protein